MPLFFRFFNYILELFRQRSGFVSVFYLIASWINKHFNDSTWHKLKEHSLLLTSIKINLDNDHIFVNIISV